MIKTNSKQERAVHRFKNQRSGQAISSRLGYSALHEKTQNIASRLPCMITARRVGLDTAALMFMAELLRARKSIPIHGLFRCEDGVELSGLSADNWASSSSS